MKYLALLFCILFFSISSNACSYRAGTTSGFILYSELIVTAYVEDILEHPTHPDTAIVTLKVGNALKGIVDSETLAVYVDLESTCPGPANYSIGATVTVFLNVNKQNRLVTNGKSHGLKQFTNAADRVKFEKLVTDRLEIAKIKSRKKFKKKMIDWSLRHVEEEVLYFVTLEEFSHYGFYFVYDKENSRYKMRRGVHFSRSVKDRLRNYLIAKKILSPVDNTLLVKLSKGNKKEMIDLAFLHLNNFDRKKGVWYPEKNLMYSISKISKRKDLADLFSQIELRPLNTKDEELLRLTELFISKVNPNYTSH